jgi:hypothetical protein
MTRINSNSPFLSSFSLHDEAQKAIDASASSKDFDVDKDMLSVEAKIISLKDFPIPDIFYLSKLSPGFEEVFADHWGAETTTTSNSSESGESSNSSSSTSSTDESEDSNETTSTESSDSSETTSTHESDDADSTNETESSDETDDTDPDATIPSFDIAEPVPGPGPRPPAPPLHGSTTYPTPPAEENSEPIPPTLEDEALPPIPGFEAEPEVSFEDLLINSRKPPENAYDRNGSKAPGRPTESTSFQSPPGGDKWAKSPNGKGYGWLDEKGNIWIPTGPGDEAHGGPH